MAPLIVRTISRYLLRQHVAPLGFALVAPVLAGATGVALLSFLWNDQLLPRTNHALRTLQVDIARKKPSLTLKEQVINEVVPGQTFLRASRIDGNTNKLKDVTLYDLSDAERRRIITADSGRMAYSAGGRDLFLTLADGDIEEVNRSDPTQFNRTFYRTNRMRVSGVGNIFTQTEHDTYKSDRESPTREMQQPAAAARRDATRAAGDARLVIENDLRRLAGLAPAAATPVRDAPDTTPPGVYCRALRRIAAWLLPPEAEAQTPQGTLPRPTTSPTPAGRPVPQLWVTPGAGVGEAQRLRDAHVREATYEVEIQKKYAIARWEERRVGKEWRCRR